MERDAIPIRRWIFVVLGSLALGLGIIGIVVPLLPTTPFLLLAAACYIRGSDRLYGWLINHRVFGDYIRNYREHRAITVRAKVFTLLLLWSVIIYTAIWIVPMLWLRILIVAIAAVVTAYILRLKTMPTS
jgi:uncharacterized membrane protein YbaN (DUF454 family)